MPGSHNRAAPQWSPEDAVAPEPAREEFSKVFFETSVHWHSSGDLLAFEADPRTIEDAVRQFNFFNSRNSTLV